VTNIIQSIFFRNIAKPRSHVVVNLYATYDDFLTSSEIVEKNPGPNEEFFSVADLTYLHILRRVA